MKPHGFTRRGTAFFRVYGDGVLQVVKFNRECSGAKDLCIGLFSMYSELRPQWFTSSGCIPHYSVVNIIGERETLVFRFKPEYQDSITKQLNVLREEGIPWLNKISTQPEMSDGIRYLETSWGGPYIWNDSFKIAPYLASGDLENAHRVVQAILDQRNMAYKANRSIFQTEEEYQKYLEPRLEEDKELYRILDMTDRGDSDEIEMYLQRNYQNNVSYARFCMK